ncbi:MAG: hypothetical protein JWM12_2903 [Ilumatobacteraceae bacterium]|jgi:hypothetical protein|nr:hypothetical protein [Ilumatobacteraceae bacterium]
MFCSRTPHRPSAAVPTPILTNSDALELLDLVISRPPCEETIAFLLDDAGYGSTLFVVAGTDQPEQVLDVAEQFASAGRLSGIHQSLVLATVRPHGGVEPGDVDRWLDASEITEQHGVQLIEWFVFGAHGFTCPRDLLGEPERWRR